jgi:hypothetical protein
MTDLRAQEAEFRARARTNGKPAAVAPQPLRNPDPSQARPVRWAWQGRVAIGKLNLLVGNEGTGKGVVNAWQASQLSYGRLDGDLKGDPVNVLIVGDEDALDDTWTPRLYAAEADWRRVFFPPEDIGDLDVTTDDGIDTGENDRLRALVEGEDFGSFGSGGDSEESVPSVPSVHSEAESRSGSGV